MRSFKGLLLGVSVAGLAACSGIASQPSLTVGTAPATVVTVTAKAAAPVSSQMKFGARGAAEQFYTLYSANQFATLWGLLSPTVKSQVTKSAWVGVHNSCPGAAAGKARVIKAVTAFGSAAIITETVTGVASTPGTTEDVFSYVGGQWSYSPGELAIYRHGSIAADVASARAAGYCAGWKVF
jgi:hypothetical protein